MPILFSCRTLRLECGAQIGISASDCGQYLVIRKFEDTHNHPVSKVKWKYCVVVYHIVIFLAILCPVVGHTMEFVSVLCHSEWFFCGVSCQCIDVVHPGCACLSSRQTSLCPARLPLNVRLAQLDKYFVAVTASSLMTWSTRCCFFEKNSLVWLSQPVSQTA